MEKRNQQINFEDFLLRPDELAGFHLAVAIRSIVAVTVVVSQGGLTAVVVMDDIRDLQQSM